MKQYLARLQNSGLELSGPEISFLAQQASETDAVEKQWIRAFDRRIAELDEIVFRSLWDRGMFDTSEVDFLSLVLEHSIDVVRYGVYSARHQQDAFRQRPPAKLAAPPNVSIPRSFADLRELWDKWRRRRDIPKRQLFIAERIKKAYIRRCQSIWRRHSADFREGQVFHMEKVRDVIARQGDMARARAAMIVRTETTYYYNRGRRSVYDRTDDVGGYLFMCIRDHGTTKWCKTRYRLVYRKDEPLLKREWPPIHWNCRSEMLPLLWSNPRHRAWLLDPAMQRRNHQCEPLPAGWSVR